jgi:pyruvate dehydrogenase complex dihydrolipoamide acetyltransferase long form
MRRTIARRLTESMQTIPHYYLTIDVDIAPLANARKAMNAELEAAGKKVSLNDLIIKAAAVALRRIPEVNASWMDKEIHYHQVVDISIAVAIDDGLMTPVIRDADRKGIAQIADEVRDLAARARDKKLQPEEMTNGTFSISNLGMFGIEEFTAVINPPEGAILAVGTIRNEPVVEDGAIVPGRRMRFTMSCDHRIIDGATGAKFMAAFKRIVESEPGHGEARRGASADGAPCKGGRRDWGRGATQGAPRSSRQSAVVAVMAACHSHAAEPPHRTPPCPSTRKHSRKRGLTLFQTKRQSRQRRWSWLAG